MIDDVIIPAAGLGTRMYPITKNKIPKLMIEVQGKPLIGHAVEEAISSGINGIHVVINKRYSKLGEYLMKEYPKINVIVTEDTQGTAHTMLKAEKLVKGLYWGTIMPDVLIEGDEPAMTQLKRIFEKGKTNTIGWLELSKEQEKSFGMAEDYSVVKIENNYFKVKEIFTVDKKNGRKYYNARYICSRKFFELTKRILYKGGNLGDTEVLCELFSLEDFFGGRLSGDGFDFGIPEGYRRYLETH